MFGSFAFGAGQFARGPFILVFGPVPAGVLVLTGNYLPYINIIGEYVTGIVVVGSYEAAVTFLGQLD